MQQKDEFENLYEVLGGEENPYNTDTSIDTATQFQVPDLRARFPMGPGTLEGTEREVGSTGGSPKLQGHRHHVLSQGGGGNLPVSRSFSSAAMDVSDKISRSVATGISEGDGATDNDKYKLGTPTIANGGDEAGFGISSNPIDNGDFTANSDETLKEQMPPYVVTRYIIKV